MNTMDTQASETLIRALLGPMRPYYDAPDVTEIMINGPNRLYVERQGQGLVEVSDAQTSFSDADAVRALARAILQYSGKRLSEFELSQEARLPNQSRVHIVMDPAAKDGLSITIRRFPDKRPSLEDMVASGSLSYEAADWLAKAVKAHRNIIVSGGTGSGKTTLLNALAAKSDPSERILTIEDVSEITLPEDRHIVTLEAQMPDAKGRGGITIRELFRAALRMRPDRILVGECRGGEALDMVQAMNSGHAGSLSTVHADDPARALSRLETLCLMADVDIPIVAVRRQLLEAMDVIVQVERVNYRNAAGDLVSERRVSGIAEVEASLLTQDSASYKELVVERFTREDAAEPRSLVAL